MKQSCLCFLSAMIAVTLFTACGGDNEIEKVPERSKTSDSIALAVQTYVSKIPYEGKLYYLYQTDSIVLTPDRGKVYYVNVIDEKGLQVFNVIQEHYKEYITNVYERNSLEFFVESDYRFIHPSIYVSDFYNQGSIVVMPQIILKLKSGHDIGVILQHYPHMSVKTMTDTPTDTYVLNSSFSTSVEVLKAVMDLQTLDVVDWVEPSILSGELGIVPASTHVSRGQTP